MTDCFVTKILQKTRKVKRGVSVTQLLRGVLETYSGFQEARIAKVVLRYFIGWRDF